MTKKIVAMLCCSVFVLGTGLSIAYYNTKSFGFDENAKIVSYDDEKISVMDFEIYYEDISFFINEVSKFIPDKSHTACTAFQISETVL